MQGVQLNLRKTTLIDGLIVIMPLSPTLFFFYENIIYKNIETEIREILRIF